MDIAGFTGCTPGPTVQHKFTPSKQSRMTTEILSERDAPARLNAAAQTFGQVRARAQCRDLRPERSDRADPHHPSPHHPSGGRPRTSDRRAGPGQDQAGGQPGHGAGPGHQPGAVHPRPDARRHHRFGSDGGKRQWRARLPLHPRTGLHPAFDGRRDQPRKPAHPVGAAAGDAGKACDGGGRAPRSAVAVPCAGDPEPAGAGRHLSPARSPARPLPAADRCRLS